MKKRKTSYRTGIVIGAGMSLLLIIMDALGFQTQNLRPYFLGAVLVLFGYYNTRTYFDMLRSRKIYREGVSTEGTIDEIVHYLVSPKYLRRDEAGRYILPEDSDEVPVKFTLHIHYDVGQQRRDCILNLAATTARELRPYVIKEGERLPIKYLDKYPDAAVIDIPEIRRICDENEASDGHKGLFTTAVMAIIYGYYFYTRYMR